MLAYQERDMNRLIVRREQLTRNLERLRERRVLVPSSEIELEIENDMEEFNYIQDSIQELQQTVVQIEESKVSYALWPSLLEKLNPLTTINIHPHF